MVELGSSSGGCDASQAMAKVCTAALKSLQLMASRPHIRRSCVRLACAAAAHCADGSAIKCPPWHPNR